jgi:hypothetical protein
LPPFKTPNTAEMRRSDTEIARSGFGEFTGGFTGRTFYTKGGRISNTEMRNSYVYRDVPSWVRPAQKTRR